MSELFSQSYRNIVTDHFEGEWEPEDGLSAQEYADALADSDVTVLPAALEQFYRSVGAVEDIMEAYYFVWDPDELEVQDGYVCFMEDEDDRYTWGFPVESLNVPDPLVFRRFNAKDTWAETGATISEYLLDYFEWVFTEVEPAVEEDL